MNKTKIIGCFLCAALLAVTAAGCHSDNPQPSEPQFTTVPVERGDVVRTVYVPGELCLPDTVGIQSPVDSELAELLVGPGDEVEEGDEVAYLSQEPLESAVEQAEADFRSAKYSLHSAEYSLHSAELQLMQAEYDLENLPDSASWEEKRLKQKAVYLARQAVRLAEDNVDLAEDKAEAAEDALEQAEENLEEATVRAPCDGIVLEVKASVGDRVTKGEPIITLADLSKMRMLVTVTQEDVMSTEVGMSADITLDALPGTKLKGKVGNIMPLKSLTSQTPTYEVYLDLQDIPGGLLPGMTGGAEIFIAEKHNVLRLPRRLVKIAPDGSGRVEILENGEPVFRKVTIGVKGNNYYEIVSGLSEGDLAVQRGRF